MCVVGDLLAAADLAEDFGPNALGPGQGGQFSRAMVAALRGREEPVSTSGPLPTLGGGLKGGLGEVVCWAWRDQEGEWGQDLKMMVVFSP